MSKIPIRHYLKLRYIFKSKGWTNNVDDDYVFESFTYLLNNLTASQQALILELAEKYLWIDNGKYIPLLKDILSEDKCVNDLSSFENIIFFPVIKINDQNKTKSGNLLIYHIQTIAHMLPVKLSKRKFVILENFEQVKEKSFKLGERDVMVLIDDFLGTGKTINSTLDIILTNKSIKVEQIRVVAFTALTPSIKFLNELGITSYVKNVMVKGITDNYKSGLKAKLTAMRKIERMSSAPISYKMGFEKSEALVTMARTPNNTFSIFWSSHIKDETVYPAPFPRYNN